MLPNMVPICLRDEAKDLLTLAINVHVFYIMGEETASFTALYIGRQLMSDKCAPNCLLQHVNLPCENHVKSQTNVELWEGWQFL